MNTETRMELRVDAVQDDHRRGWKGLYFTDKGVKTVTSRWCRRAALLFPSEQEARLAAAEALLKHLNSTPRPRSSGAKTFAVARNGRNVRTISLPRT